MLPALVTRFVPFPSLEEAEYLEGSFAYEGDWPQARLPRYFVVSASGRHEFHCGYLGARHTCFTQPAVFVGQRMKVWNSFWYGSIQHQVEPRTGRIPYPLDVWDWRYADSRALSLDPRYSRAGSINWFAIVLLGGYAAWLAIRHRWARGESRAG